jgi:hypothetical protein
MGNSVYLPNFNEFRVCLFKVCDCPSPANYNNSFSVCKTHLKVAKVQNRIGIGTFRSNHASEHSWCQELQVKFLSSIFWLCSLLPGFMLRLAFILLKRKENLFPIYTEGKPKERFSLVLFGSCTYS